MGERTYYENRELWDPRGGTDTFDRLRFDLVLSLLPDGVRTMLDAGCGNGRFLDHCRGRCERAIGMDRSSAAIAVAKQTFRIPAIRGEVSRLPFRDGAFDAVVALEVLEHLPFSVYEGALSELQRVARRAIVVNVPDAEKRLLVTCPYCGTRFHPAYHLRSFSRRSLEGLFDQFTLRRCERVRSDQVDFSRYPRLLKAYHAVVHPRLPGHVPIPAGARCPACDYGAADDRAAARAGRRPPSGVRRRLLRLLPLRRYREAVAVYLRQGCGGPGPMTITNMDLIVK